MAKISVPQAAERLGVSPARVRQRIEDGSLVAEKIGGRWLVDLEVSQPAPARAGRPVSQFSVWWSLAASEIAKAALPSSQLAELHRSLDPARAVSRAARASVDVSGIQKALKPAVESAAFKKAALSAVDSSALRKAAAVNVQADALRKALKPISDAAGAHRKALKPISDAAAAQRKALEPFREAASRQRSLLARMRIAEAVLVDLEHASGHGGGSAVDEFVSEAQRLSRSSRNRAVHRLADAVENRDHDLLLAWLSNRSQRRLFVAASSDLNALRNDPRLVASGLSDPRSGMDDLRVLEGYVKASNLEALASEYWLENPGIDDRPNVIVHVSPVLPPAIGPMLLAADLAEHGGPREALRAHELLDEAIDALNPVHESEAPA